MSEKFGYGRDVKYICVIIATGETPYTIGASITATSLGQYRIIQTCSIGRTYYSVVDVIAPLQNLIPAVELLASENWSVFTAHQGDLRNSQLVH